MDLGKTALGNWKAQQGGCTHIQVRLHLLHIFASPPAFAHYLKDGGFPLFPPPPLLQFFNEISDLK